ncbi:MAG: DJ-1/PfpI family protein [Hapalosiphonaceae cyanobacterium JJU2]|nr:MAG: DJ-1/PfpI family protein [Hapalosiphonaceae cyanobacterium JJU2]
MSNQRNQSQSEKTIACVIFPGLTALDLIGPLEVLNCLTPDYKAVTVGERIEAMPCESKVRLTPEQTFEDVPNPHILLVPGGDFGPFEAMVNDRVMQYIQTAAQTAERVVSVCSGSLILAAAGLLKNRQATTHWAAASVLEKWGAQYVSARWVEDGKFITAAGVSAGIEMALYLAAQLTSEEKARLIQAGMEYNPHPPEWGIDWSQMNQEKSQALAQQLGYNSLKTTFTIAKILFKRPDLLAKLAF